MNGITAIYLTRKVKKMPTNVIPRSTLLLHQTVRAKKPLYSERRVLWKKATAASSNAVPDQETGCSFFEERGDFSPLDY